MGCVDKGSLSLSRIQQVAALKIGALKNIAKFNPYVYRMVSKIQASNFNEKHLIPYMGVNPPNAARELDWGPNPTQMRKMMPIFDIFMSIGNFQLPGVYFFMSEQKKVNQRFKTLRSLLCILSN